MAEQLPCMVLPMGGLGDTIYQRPFIRAQAAVRGEVFVRTPWPEFFVDLPGVKPTFPHSMKLRTQGKNIRRHADWCAAPPRYEQLTPRYNLRQRGVSICEELERCIPLAGQPFVFDLPDFGPSPVQSSKPVAVIRPVTLRKEWLNYARAPKPEYLAHAARWLRGQGFHVVSVADVDGEQEWLVPPAPLADEYFVRGELCPADLMALVQGASVAVGGVGWIVPAALAAGTPLIAIGGGHGGYNAPEIVTDQRMDLTRTRFLLPDTYCLCKERLHDCPKEITDFPARFLEAVHGVGIMEAAA